MAHPIKSLVWATDIDVLAADHLVEFGEGYRVVRSPSNPTYWWGNFLLFDDPPAAGDGERWEGLFAREFARHPDVTHRSFGWDRTDGAAGAAEQELVARGYELEWTCGLVATPERIAEHPRANREVEVRALAPDGDGPLWDAVVELQMSQAPAEWNQSSYHRTFLRRRQRELREIFSGGGRGGWYVALLGGEVAGSLGVVVTGTGARYQTVDTAARFRRRGIAHRLVADAARDAYGKHEIDHLVIAADPDYHAIGIYEELGFERAELVVGALRKPERS